MLGVLWSEKLGVVSDRMLEETGLPYVSWVLLCDCDVFV